MKENTWQLVGNSLQFSDEELKLIIECKAKCHIGISCRDIRLYVTINIKGKKKYLMDNFKFEGGRCGVLLDKISIKLLNLKDGEECDVNPRYCLFYILKNTTDNRIIRRVRIVNSEDNCSETIIKESSYISKNNYGRVNVVKNASNQFGVVDSEGHIIIPFGKYGWIDGFDSGLARVHSHAFPDGQKRLLQMYKWGIINEEGEEVLPLEYDNIWNFLGKNRYSTKVIKGDMETEVFFHDLNPSLPIGHVRYYHSKSRDSYYDDEYRVHYGEYAGSYAQDEMGYCDEEINDAFDGDPDAYWNID